MKHTPGPWDHNDNLHESDGIIEIFDALDEDGLTPIAHVLREGRSFFDTKANARLIAAAPDLYEALIAISKAFADGEIQFTKKRQSDSDPYCKSNILMCAAIAKAEGRE